MNVHGHFKCEKCGKIFDIDVVFESRFILEKGGKRQEFTLDNYPDSTWTFVESRTILKEKGYEPPIHDFSMMSLDRFFNAAATIADTLNVFLLLALPMDALKLPNVPMTESCTLRISGAFS